MDTIVFFLSSIPYAPGRSVSAGAQPLVLYVFDDIDSEYEVIIIVGRHLDDMNPRWPPKFLLKMEEISWVMLLVFVFHLELLLELQLLFFY